MANKFFTDGFVIWDDASGYSLEMRIKYRANYIVKRMVEQGRFVYYVFKSKNQKLLKEGNYLSSEEFQQFVDDNPHLFV